MTTHIAFVALLLVILVFPMASFAKQNPGITCELSSPTRVIKKGESVAISWRSAGAMIWYGPNGENIAPAGTMVVSPTKRTIYKFKFVGIGGNRTCGIRIRIEGQTVPA